MSTFYTGMHHDMPFFITVFLFVHLQGNLHVMRWLICAFAWPHTHKEFL